MLQPFSEKNFHKHIFMGGTVALLTPIHTVFHRSYSPAVSARNEIFLYNFRYEV